MAKGNLHSFTNIYHYSYAAPRTEHGYGDTMTKQISCREAGFDCDFEVRSESDDEVIEFARQHAEQSHDMELSRSDLEEYLQEV